MMNPTEAAKANAALILIVEDSATQAQLLRHVLDEHGYSTLVAGSGREAMEILGSHRPDLILSDIVMPEMDGYELTRKIKRHPALKSIPVILLTALTDPEDIVRGLDARVESYLIKPCDEGFLLSKVESLLAAPPTNREGEGLQRLEVSFRGRSHTLTLAPEHAVNLVFSIYENAVQINEKLLQTQMELEALNFDLENKVQERTAHLQAEIVQRKKAEEELTRAREQLELRVQERTAELMDVNESLTREISERKKAEEEIRILNAELEERVAQRTSELETSNRELKEFAYVVSHDLKAPLRAVSQLAGWLSSDFGEALGEEGRAMIDMLLGRLDRMHNLIEGILQYSRIGRAKEEKVDVDLNTVVRDVVDSLAPPEHVSIEVLTTLPTIKFERTRSEQLFQNLISNAIKFMDKPHGFVKINCADGGSHWTLSVSDNGPGIEPKYHDKIFQIFQTLSPRDEFESTGIGLTLVKKIVEVTGGRIWVESQPGEGTTFLFTLPKTA